MVLLVPSCAMPSGEVSMAEAPGQEAQVTFLAGDLVQVVAEIPDARRSAVATGETARDRIGCALSEAMLAEGTGFARHVRTTLGEEAGILRVDAVYTVSKVRPAGDFVIVAEEVAAACRAAEATGGANRV